MKTKTKSRTNMMRRVISFIAVVVVLTTTFVVPAIAAEAEQDAATMVNKYIDNATNVVNIIVSAIGAIIFLWGAVLFALAMNSHDAAQKMQGMIALFSGVLVFAAPWLLEMIKG